MLILPNSCAVAYSRPQRKSSVQTSARHGHSRWEKEPEHWAGQGPHKHTGALLPALTKTGVQPVPPCPPLKRPEAPVPLDRGAALPPLRPTSLLPWLISPLPVRLWPRAETWRGLPGARQVNLMNQFSSEPPLPQAGGGNGSSHTVSGDKEGAERWEFLPSCREAINLSFIPAPRLPRAAPICPAAVGNACRAWHPARTHLLRMWPQDRGPCRTQEPTLLSLRGRGRRGREQSEERHGDEAGKP